MKISTVILAVAFLVLAVPNSSYAAKKTDKLFTESCPAPLQTRLQQAKQMLVRYQKRLANDFEIDSRNGQERRAQRQILRRVEKIQFKCKMDRQCNTHTAVQSVVGGNHIRICGPALAHAPFHKVVETVAHEFGHNAHIPRARAGAHNRRGRDNPDRVYQFGFFARELTMELYGMGFRVGDRRDPVRTPGLVPAFGITLYPHKDFKGYPISFASWLDTTGRFDFKRWESRHRRMNDLRMVGRNDAISSIKVKSGRWEVCAKKDFQGKCRIIDASISNLKSIKMDNKISSIRYVGASRPGS